MKNLGAEVEMCENGKETLSDGVTQIDLPPIILAKLGSDSKKKTVCLYGHLDVQPAAKVHVHVYAQQNNSIDCWNQLFFALLCIVILNNSIAIKGLKPMTRLI